MAGLARSRPTNAQLWAWLDTVPDPEIPVISVTDLGIIRGLRWERQRLVVTITPTYSGCPAIQTIQEDIRATLSARGVADLRLETRLSPAWSTDWLSGRGRAQLRSYGIAPPGRGAQQVVDISRISRRREPAVACPHCGSAATGQISRFASTPCKALYRCRDCLEPFDYFKEH